MISAIFFISGVSMITAPAATIVAPALAVGYRTGWLRVKLGPRTTDGQKG